MLTEVEKRTTRQPPFKQEFIVINPYEIEVTNIQVVSQIINLIEEEGHNKKYPEMRIILEDIFQKNCQLKTYNIGWEAWQSKRALSNLLIRESHLTSNESKAIEVIHKLLTGKYQPIDILPKVARILEKEADWNLLNTLAEWKEEIKNPCVTPPGFEPGLPG